MDAISVHRPCLSQIFAAKLAKKFYNFKTITEMKEFGSYSDRNFYIRGKRTSDECANQDQTSKLKVGEYVLKILNSVDSKHGDFVDAENDTMLFLRKKQFPCPELYPVAGSSALKLLVQIPLKFMSTMDEAYSSTQEDENRHLSSTEECIIRLISFLPGDTVASLPHLSHDKLFIIGQFVGRLSRSLQELQCPVLRQRESRWNLESFPSLQEYISVIEDEESKRLIRDVMARFTTHVSPKISFLRRGILHNDVSRTNLLIDEKDGNFKISGLIDFGDMCCSYLLFELAITVASFMNENDVLTDSGYIIAGYQAVFPLPGMEFELLCDSISARLSQVYIITAKEERENAQNKYLTKTLADFGVRMKGWLKYSKEEVMNYWRSIGLGIN